MARKLSDSAPAYRQSKEIPCYDTTEARPGRPPLHVKTSRASRSIDLMHEESPLLSPISSNDDKSPPRAGSILGQPGPGKDDGQQTKSTWYLFLLTLSIGGLQIAWSVELSHGSPYLLSLGMNKSLLAFVWIAGPLSGTLVQPYVGIRSDNCRISWGRRKPFMLAGGAATILSLVALAWAREIVRGILGVFGADPMSRGVHVVTLIFAIFSVYVLDFAINTVQAGIRAFIVDNAPTHQQEDANAWAGRLTGVGNVLGYLSGYVDLPKIMPFFGNTQFKVLCVIACFALGGTLIVSSLSIRERDPRLEGPPSVTNSGILSFFSQVFKSMRRLPPQIRRVCEVQFFNWIGWFPFLFYITTYIGQLYVNPIFEANPDMSPEEIDAAWEKATRVGTFALLIFAITSFTSNMLLPLLITPSYQPPDLEPPSDQHHPRASTPGTPGTLSASMSEYFAPKPVKKPSRLSHFLTNLQIPGLTLRRAWLLSHLLFAACMCLTFLVRTPAAATVLVGVIGISWALTLWAPFALISAEISKRDSLRRGALRLRPQSNSNSTYNLRNPPPPQPQRQRQQEDDEPCEDQAGVILGLHNVAIAAPQIIATLMSSAIFRALQKPRGVGGDDSVGWVLRVGGVAALAAAYMTTRIGEESESDGDGEGEGMIGEGDESEVV
ncbi:hypothetical protein MMC16_000526 [Acarospora aff. strigata]|nr:hypothetical protein [Acarospora aff. strigata]